MDSLSRMKLVLLLGVAASAPVQPVHADPPPEDFVGVTCGYLGVDPTASGRQEGVYGGGPWLLGEALPGTPALPDALELTCSVQVNDDDPAGKDAAGVTTTSIGPIVGVPPRRAVIDVAPTDSVFVCTEVRWSVGGTSRTLRYDADPGRDGDQCAPSAAQVGSTYVAPTSACASSDAFLFGELTPKRSDTMLSASFERSVQHLRGLRTAGTTTNVCGGGASDED